MRSRVTAENDRPDRCYDTAVRMLQYRWHGREELRRKLVQKGYSPEVVGEALERLAGEKWIDDHRFALSLARSVMARGRGRGRVEQELFAAGVDGATARAAIEELFDEDRESAALERLCRKKMRSLAPSSPADAAADDGKRNKLIAYLLNQGYEYAAVRAVIKRIAGESLPNAHE